MVQYSGNETIYVPKPHGNQKRPGGTAEFTQSAPSLFEGIVKETQKGKKPNAVYATLMQESNLGTMQGVLTPRNNKQIQNKQYYEKTKKRFGKDDVGNLLELAKQLDNFVWSIDFHPDLDVVIGLKEMFDLFNELLETQTHFQITLGYDTTFKCGNFYISPILFRHIYFENSPVIPLAFLIHDRKLTTTHEKLFRQLKERIPNLGKMEIPLIVDR